MSHLYIITYSLQYIIFQYIESFKKVKTYTLYTSKKYFYLSFYNDDDDNYNNKNDTSSFFQMEISCKIRFDQVKILILQINLMHVFYPLS